MVNENLNASYWVDGEPTQMLCLPDRGLDFGDGLFETFLLAQGRLFYSEHHLLRLELGLRKLGFPECLGRVENQLQSVLQELTLRDVPQAVLRLTVTRGSGQRGYAPPTDTRPRIIIVVTPRAQNWRLQSAPANLGVAATRWGSQPQLAGIKHLNRLEQVLAASECAAAGCDEMIMLDQNGHAVSVISGNLFVVKDNKIMTPSLRNCGIRGTRRQRLIEHWAPALGVQVQEETIDLPQLQEADELFYTNSLQGLRPIAALESVRWNSHRVCEALHTIYKDENP